MPKVAKPQPIGKPSKDFPLTPHRNGSWCKKVRGKLIYFGPVGDSQAALDLWLQEKDELLAGHDPSVVRSRDRTVDRFTVKDAINAYLKTKEQHADAGKITRRHFEDLKVVGKLLADTLGKTKWVESLTPQDFGDLRAKLAKTNGPAALLKRVICIRSIFKFALENQHITKAVPYGSMFDLPEPKELRKARASKPKRLFSAADLKRLIDAASVQLKAMILLAANCGLGNSDCGQLEERHLDLEGGWLDYPRPKTANDRKAKLWPETVEAIQAATAARPAAKRDEHAGLIFVTRCGDCWAKDKMDNPITKEFRKLLGKLDLHQTGFGFYTLRHTYATIAGGSRDQVVVDFTMGHCDPAMSARYREEIDDSRFQAVADHVHRWLFAKAKPATKAKPKPKPKAKPKPASDEKPRLRVVG